MKTMLIIETSKGREKMLRTMEEALAEGEAIVKITDTVSEEKTLLTVPKDPNAEVVAREPPKLMPGGVTALISYVRVSAGAFKGIEYRLEEGEVASSRDVTLRAERVGRRKRSRAETRT